MDAAIDRAASTLAGSGQPGSAEAAAPSASSSSAAGSPPAAPAAGSGVTESAPAASTQGAPAATGPGDDDGDTLSSQDWLDLQKRREILNGARTRERAKLLKDLGLSTDAPLDQVRQHLSLMLTDLPEYHRQLTATLQARGVIPRPAASEPPTAPQAARPTRAPMPQPDLVFSDGRRAYSAESAAALVDWVADGLRNEFGVLLDERLGPMQQTHQAMRAQQFQAEARQIADTVLAEASTWAYFSEFAPRIAEMMQADRRVTVQSAYNRLLQERLKTEPARLKEEARQATLRELQTTTKTGSPSITPGRPVVAERRKGGSSSLDDALDAAISRAVATVSATT